MRQVLSRKFMVAGGISLACLVCLLLGRWIFNGQAYRLDELLPVSENRHRLPDALVVLEADNALGVISDNTPLLRLSRPERFKCEVMVYTGNPRLTSFRINHVIITASSELTAPRTALDIKNPTYADFEATDFTFHPYDTTPAITRDLPIGRLSYAWASLNPPLAKAPLLHNPDGSTRYRVTLDMTLLSGETPICTRTVETEFGIRRREGRIPWIVEAFWRLIMPRF